VFGGQAPFDDESGMIHVRRKGDGAAEFGRAQSDDDIAELIAFGGEPVLGADSFHHSPHACFMKRSSGARHQP
jgi:hypothetical protein